MRGNVLIWLLLLVFGITNGLWYADSIRTNIELHKANEQIRLMRCRSLAGAEDEQDVPGCN